MIHDEYLKMLRRHLIEQAKSGERLSYNEFCDNYVLVHTRTVTLSNF